jgi:hypothetical protein
MDRALVPLGNTPPRPLDLERLRSDLSTLWREEGKGVSRACHDTLVVVVSPGEDPDPLLEDLVLTHPSRVLRVERDPKLPPTDVVAWASGCCMKRSSGMLVCSEIVHFQVGEAAGERLPSVIRSLAVGGVPLVVICRQASPLGLDWIDAVAGDLDLIVGRSSALGIVKGLELARESIDADRRPRVEDLTWDEIEPWRAVIQSSFDHARAVSRLDALSELKLELGKQPGLSTPGLYLAGWLGSRLRWNRPASLGADRVRVDRSGGHTVVVFQPGLVIDAVTFAFDDGGEPMRWTAKDLRAESSSAPLSRALHRHAFDPVAVAARKMALKLAEAIRS